MVVDVVFIIQRQDWLDHSNTRRSSNQILADRPALAQHSVQEAIESIAHWHTDEKVVQILSNANSLDISVPVWREWMLSQPVLLSSSTPHTCLYFS